MTKKTRISLIIVSTLLIATITIAVSYAYWTTTKSGTETNIVTSGCFDMTLTNESNAIDLQKAYPITDSEAESLTPYTFTITNTCDLYASYNVNLEVLAGSDLPSTAIATRVNDNEKKILGTLAAGEKAESTSVESRTLISGELYPNESVSYRLRMWMDESVTLEDNVEGKTLNAKIVLVGTPNKTDIPYKESTLNGTDPVIADNLVPVTIEDDGIVKKANLYSEWYDYETKKWANAVILEDTSVSYDDGEAIPEENIESYFVWIPKYKYRLWNVGVNDTTTLVHTIDIVFDTTNTTDVEGISCATPMTSGESGNCNNGEYMTHPAFISMEVNGIWVGKFELTGSIDNLTVKPNEVSLINKTLSESFNAMYNYNRALDSHMMKNTEWGAVAYLSHSKYGIDREININNNSAYKTGYSAKLTTQQQIFPGETGDGGNYNSAYNTTIGYLASTTGNISGIYDMLGGAYEYMAAYRNGASVPTGDAKYFDVYDASSAITTYNYRILGDATGEMGPFINYKDGDGDARWHSKWYGDYSYFVESNNPWFHRGGGYDRGVLAGQFYFDRYTGAADSRIGSRLVLAP